MTARAVRPSWLAIALSLIAAGETFADENARVEGLGGGAEEMAGWAALDEYKWVRAREIGEKLIRDAGARGGESYPGEYVLGVAMHYGEGDLAQSAFHLERAIRIFEARYGEAGAKTSPWRWHEAALKELAYTYGEMDRPAEEIDVFDKFDRAYEPKRLAQRVWPLMKLRRYDEARLAAKAAAATGTVDQRAIARSDLCAAECEAGSRERAWQACTDALADFRRPGGVPGLTLGGMVEFSNASEAALSVLKYDEAERFLAEATRRAVADSWANPYQHLGMLLMTEGRVPEAIAALKDGQELRLRRAAWLDQHGQARLDQTLSHLLLVLGQSDRAVQIGQRAADRPDRMGVNSGTERQALAASAVGLAAALSDQAARRLEEALTAGFVAGVKLRARAASAAFQAWRERRRAAVMLADEDFLERSLRPYYVGGIDLPPWMVSEVVAAVGGGVILRALARARALEPLAGSGAFFDALEAEAHFERGDDAQALAAAERALAPSGTGGPGESRGLPRAEVLLSARVSAIAGESARRLGDRTTEAARFTLALQRDPAVLRRLGIRVPVEVQTAGGGIAERAAALVGKSPRFRVGDGPFRVVIESAPPRACLLGTSREVIQCAQPKPMPGASDEEVARALVDELHQAAFALRSDLSQEDLSTLDGSPTAQRADHQVKSLLDTLGDSATR